MSKAIYVGVGGIARKVPKLYVGVNGAARKVKKGYIGVNGVARLFYDSGASADVEIYNEAYYRTTDGNLPWAYATSGQGNSRQVVTENTLVYLNGKFFICGHTSNVWLAVATSTTGSSWDTYTLEDTWIPDGTWRYIVRGVFYINGRYIIPYALEHTSGTSVSYTYGAHTSTSGTSWTDDTSYNKMGRYDKIVQGNNKLVGLLTNNALMTGTSVDGKNWSDSYVIKHSDNYATQYYADIVFEDGLFTIVASERHYNGSKYIFTNYLFTSPDGSNWTTVKSETMTTWPMVYSGFTHKVYDDLKALFKRDTSIVGISNEKVETLKSNINYAVSTRINNSAILYFLNNSNLIDTTADGSEWITHSLSRSLVGTTFIANDTSNKKCMLVTNSGNDIITFSYR